ncbi:MAG: GxxExxY protein [Desulfuromonadaceae bacterium]|nr:GxxExxY protein [Desulfuromonadaceae bacterium]
MLYENISEQILKGFYKVYNTLGYGFLEKVYENALLIELHAMGLEVSQQHPICVYYESRTVGEYFADLLVNNTVILELKVAEQLRTEHVAQLRNYLKATDKELGLLLNFGKDPEFKRVVFTKRFKNQCESAASV